MISTCTFSKLHFWGSWNLSRPAYLTPHISPRSAAATRHRIQWRFMEPFSARDLTTVCCHLIHSRFMEPFSARRFHHGLLPPRAISFTRGHKTLFGPNLFLYSGRFSAENCVFSRQRYGRLPAARGARRLSGTWRSSWRHWLSHARQLVAQCTWWGREAQTIPAPDGAVRVVISSGLPTSKLWFPSRTAQISSKY